MTNERVDELRTPALVLDQPRLDRNVARMRATLHRLNKPLRPHAKTAKSIEVVRRALEGQPGGITVSTMAEAAWFFERGIVDIVYAVGISPQRLPAAAELISSGCRSKLLADSSEMARAAADAGVRLGAGWMALSRDRGREGMDLGYGVVCDALLAQPISDLIVISTNQEHGIVASRGGDSTAALSIPIGTRLRVLPNHACATAAMHDVYHVADERGAIKERWPRMRGW